LFFAIITTIGLFGLLMILMVKLSDISADKHHKKMMELIDE